MNLLKMSESGICKIKPEFILPEQPREIISNCVSEKDKLNLEPNKSNNEVEPEAKRPKLTKSEKKKLKGQNKARGPTFKYNRTIELCSTFINVTENEELPKCEKKNCQFIHDIQEYLKAKPDYVGDTCYNFQTFGICRRGLSCRFKEHITENGRNIIDNEKISKCKSIDECTLNQLQQEVQRSLRKRTYDFTLAENAVKNNDKKRTEQKQNGVSQEPAKEQEPNIGCVIEESKREKKKLDWTDKLLLSPLTTVGNLPFRRICKEFGADITCGEMAMCNSLLQGAPQEWALVKRHHSEDIFGVQLCGNNPYSFAKCAQMLEKETQIDFIDINLGCPIDLVYREGGGCGLLLRPRILECITRSISDVLTIPLTIKIRTGVHSNENLAHIFAPKIRDWGASLLTIHGRSREQRYTRSANWDYIREVAQAASPLPVVGNGDILSYEDYLMARNKAPEITSVMIGRGALIKPWIFQEIKEQRIIDISSSERMDILKKYVNYGLEHWGSDTKGVENTRRFLLEWLSFLYRYVPVGVLEQPPQKINERPPYYIGRNDLETLMASPSCSDWIKISEMLLGPVPENFKFLPKHKANSYK